MKKDEGMLEGSVLRKGLMVFLVVVLVLGVVYFAFGEGKTGASLTKSDLIKDKRTEYVGVFPGEIFCVNRNLDGEDLYTSPIWGDSAELVSIDLVTRGEVEKEFAVTEFIKCERSYLVLLNVTKDNCSDGVWDEELINCVQNVSETYSCPEVSNVSRTEEEVSYSDITGLRDASKDVLAVEVKNKEAISAGLGRIALSERISGASEVRYCFRAPTLEEISGGATNSGHILFQAYNDKYYDLEHSVYWNSSWLYYQNFTFYANSTSGNSLSNYSEYVVLNTSYLISQGKMQPNCGDIRIVNSSGVVIPYLVQNGTCDSNSTVIWFNNWVFPLNAYQTYSVFYGNNASIGTGNASAVFIDYNIVILGGDVQDLLNGTTLGLANAPLIADVSKYGKAMYFSGSKFFSTNITIGANPYSFSLSLIGTALCDGECSFFTASGTDGVSNFINEYYGDDFYSSLKNSGSTQLWYSTTVTGKNMRNKEVVYAVSVDRSNLNKLLINGSYPQSANNQSTGTISVYNPHIGAWNNGGTLRYFTGYMAAFKFAYKNHSQAWLDAEYNGNYAFIGIENNNTEFIPPINLSIQSPANNTLINNTPEVSFNYTMTSANQTANCTLFNGSTVLSTSTNTNNNTLSKLNITSGYGIYSGNITCWYNNTFANATWYGNITISVPCQTGNSCNSCTGWSYINLNEGGSLQVRDSNNDNKYDQSCCGGTVTNTSAA